MLCDWSYDDVCHVFTTEWRQVGGRTHKASLKSSLFLCFYSGFVQIETSNAPSWWCQESMHALIHLSPHSSLLYYLSHGKEIIPCSHVFNRSSKRNTKTAFWICLRTFKKVNTCLCRSEGDEYVPWAELCLTVFCLLLCSLLLLPVFAGFYGFHPYWRLNLRCTKLPINVQNLCPWYESFLEIEKC